MAEQNLVQPEVNASISIAEFLEDVPPGQLRTVADLIVYKDQRLILNLPELLLHCDTSEKCDGMRQFRCYSDVGAARDQTDYKFVTYVCKNCTQSLKTFALRVSIPSKSGYSGQALKLGEFPNFGPSTPPRLTRLLGADKDLFLKGRRAENQGMGIAAFAYYRRVIESQKNAIFDEIIRVAKGISADPKMIEDLELAKKQVQFTSAVEAVKHGIPPVLMINGHNPLTLLHSALSEGLHEKSDADCLAWATDMRIVIAEFVERMAQAMKDNAELRTSVSRLLNRNAPSEGSRT
jgi:hypothetical protein